MGLFGDRDAVKRDYNALLGKSVQDDILVLTESMRVGDGSLDLLPGDIAKHSDADVKAAKDRLRQELKRKYDNDISEIRQQIETLEQERADTQRVMKVSEPCSTRAQLNAINGDIKAMKDTVSQQALKERDQELFARQEELNNSQAELKGTRRQLEQLETELADKGTRVKDLSRALSATRRENDITIERLCRLQREGIDGASRLDAQRQAFRDLQTELFETREKLGSAEFKLADFQDRMVLRQLKSVESNHKLECARAKHNRLTESAARLKDKLSETQIRLDQILANNKTLRSELKTVQAERDKLVAREDVVRDTLTMARDKLSEMKERADETQAENAFAMAQNRALRARQDELLAQIRSLQIADEIAPHSQNDEGSEILERRLQTAQGDLDIMGKVNTMLRARLKTSEQVGGVPATRQMNL